MSFFQRFFGVFLNPDSTFKSISEKPTWRTELVLLLIVLIFFSYLTTSYSTKDRLVLLKDNVKLQERMGEERFNQMIERLENPSQKGRIIQALIMTPIGAILGFLLSSGILFGAGRIFSTQGNFKQLFSSFLQAAYIDRIFGNIVRYFLIISKKSVFQTSTGLPIFFPHLEVTSPLYTILSQFDFFQLWMFGVLGYGIAHVFKLPLKKSLFISFGFWLVKSIIYSILGILALKYYSG
ncbi:MAG: YIP1 family protein [Candidatus Aminicenantia bacterium]